MVVWDKVPSGASWQAVPDVPAAYLSQARRSVNSGDPSAPTYKAELMVNYRSDNSQATGNGNNLYAGIWSTRAGNSRGRCLARTRLSP